MGKGDKRTFKGKLWRASYGKSRPKPVTETKAAPKTTGKKGR